MAFPADVTIVGAVLAITVAILLLSGLALYVAFRVRDTLREEKGRGARAAKVAFLIGLLFLSGGVFYFFASGFGASGGSTPVTGTTSATLSTSYSSTSSSSSPPVTSTSSSATSSSSTTTTTTTTTGGGSVTLQASYPSTVSAGQGFYVQFSIYSSGTTALSGASLDLGGLSTTFTVVNATVCDPGCSPVTLSGGVINIGTLAAGSTAVQVGLRAPSSPTQFSGTATLNYQGEAQPASAAITIRVSGRP